MLGAWGMCGQVKWNKSCSKKGDWMSLSEKGGWIQPIMKLSVSFQ